MIIDWITPVNTGSVAPSDLTYLSIAFLSGPDNLYFDISIIDGIVQPIGGIGRPLGEIAWDFSHATNELSQVRNATDSTMAAEGATGTRYQIEDGVAIPVDGELRFERFVEDDSDESRLFGIGIVTSQNTRLLRVENDGGLIASSEWRADIDLSVSAQPDPFVAGPYFCLPHGLRLDQNVPDTTVQLFDDNGGPVIGQTNYSALPFDNVSQDMFLSGTALADGIGYLRLSFPGALVLESVGVEGRAGECFPPAEDRTGFVDAVLTPL